MALLHEYLFHVMWLCYIGYWWVAARDVKATEHQETDSSRTIRLITIISAIALLSFPNIPGPVISRRFIGLGSFPYWVGASITGIGLLFSAWARQYLGTNWSQAVTIKEGHELITSGPYALVRHPIYTGLLLALFGSAVARGEYRGLIAVALVTAVIWRKLRLEEKWLQQEFGQAYQAYSARVPALLPYLI